MHFLQNCWQGFIQFILSLPGILPNPRLLGRRIRAGIKNLNEFRKSLKLRKSVIFALTLLLFFTAVTLIALVPTNTAFEGSLTVRELSFISNQSDQLFLKRIEGIKRLSIEGIQTLKLPGSFESKYYSRRNNTLEIKLINSTSQLIIYPEDLKQSSELEMQELRLQQNTKVTDLSYSSLDPDKGNKIHRLSLSLKPDSSPATANHKNSLRLYLGEKPLKIEMVGYQLPQLGLQDSIGRPESLEFTFKPDGKDIEWHITHPVSLVIDLPDPNQPDSEQWFQGDIEAKDVSFVKDDRSGVDSKDYSEKSTILQGQIRMGGKELKINKNQFIEFENSGIKRFHSIKVSAPQDSQDLKVRSDDEVLKILEQAKGLEVDFTGRTTGIKVSLDRELPVDPIRSYFWSKIFDNDDVIVALVSFSSAMIVSLLTWLFDNFSKTSNP